MANKAKKSNQANSNETTSITRIKAVDSKLPKVTKSKAKTPKLSQTDRKVPKLVMPILAVAGYFKGAWYELRQVRWPNRRATWSLTGAVIAFTAFFVVLILLLDVLFKYVFELILA